MKWISVKDRLPTFELVSEDLLLLHKDGTSYTGYYQQLADHRGLIVNINQESCPYFHPIPEDRIKVVDITHWMPLPPNPEDS